MFDSRFPRAGYPLPILSLLLFLAASPLTGQEAGWNFERVQPELMGERGSMTHAWGDFDNDGDLDLYVGFRPGQPNRLYRNDGGRLVEVGAQLGVADAEGTRAVAWGDYNADGHLDLYVGYTAGSEEGNAQIPNRVYRNDGGRFTEVTEGLDLQLPLGHARQISWVDYDNDGDVDLFFAIRDFPNRLFRNDDGAFVDVSQAMGITGSRATMGGVWFDYDLDGDLDLYLGNMDGFANRMYRNDGTRFVDVAPDLGIDGGGRAIDPNPGDHDMAGTIRPDIADFDNDGDFDIFVTSLGGTDGFYRNDDGAFVSVADEYGLAHESYRGTAAWADFDNDGWIDLYSSGTLYRNDRGRFLDVTPEIIRESVGGYGSIWADFDNDGAMDLALSSANHFVIRNLLPPEQAARSLKVMVLNEGGIHTRAGTEVRLYVGGTRQLLGTRIIETGSGYNAQSVRPVHFGVPGEGTVDVELTLMGEGGRKTVLIEGVDPKEHAGGHLSVKVDGQGRIVR
ncbi:CRTAC1 family protein [Gemmatimonadota bacterium]